MKKFILNSFLVFIFIFISLTLILSTIGIETDRFNNLISKKINQYKQGINLEFSTIKFKIDIKETSLFLETIKPKIVYEETIVSAKHIKAYIDFISLLRSEPKITKINFALEELDVQKIKKLSIKLKPSNLSSFIQNKIEQGLIKTEIEIYLDSNNSLENFIVKGTVSNLKTKIIKNIVLNKTSFKFFADKTDILIKKIFGEIDTMQIKDGDLKVKLSPEITFESNFNSNIKLDTKSLDNLNLLKDLDFTKNLIYLEADLNNSLFVNFDKTYKVKEYNYKSSGNIRNANFNLKKPLKSPLFENQISEISIFNSDIKTSFNSKKNNMFISGKYSLNKGSLLNFDLKNTSKKDELNLDFNVEYDWPLELEIINYNKQKDKIAKISGKLKKKKDNLEINDLSFFEGKNSIVVEDVKFYKKKFLSLKKILFETNKNGKNNNNFSILFDKKISINGNQFDASNLPKILKQENQSNLLLNITKDIEINFKNITAPLSEKLKNFKLIGVLNKGKFIKISAKGDFGGNNFLDISMKKDANKNKKYLEIYSDLTNPLLTEYSFFNGLTGGKLLYTSIIDGNISNSKLKIENFKVVGAPGIVKLLSLADLGGLADLAEGEGLSFDILEIKMEQNDKILKLNEILALGPSISVLMEGYQDPGTTSLRGTLVPAKTLNKMISKIPVLGSIIIPKEVGEGLFGISFKMKGPPGKIKTTLNPIKTITPRFIQKIIEKNKNFN